MMRAAVLLMLVWTGAVTVDAATCGDCSVTCFSPDTPKSATTYCGDSCTYCSSTDCCTDFCYLDVNDHSVPAVPANMCPNDCCWFDNCGTEDQCNIAKSIATLIIVCIVISIVCFICVILCICYCIGCACFAGMKASQKGGQQHYAQTHVVQQPYANMQGQPMQMQGQPGAPYPGVKG